jgi:hypothetical protein
MNRLGYLLGGSEPSWNPTKMDGLVAWYSADTGVTKVGSAVTVWADQSGNGYDLIPATAVNPTWSAIGINGKPALGFDVANAGPSAQLKYYTDGSITVLNGKTRLSWFAVVHSHDGTGAISGQMQYGGTWSNMSIYQHDEHNMGFTTSVSHGETTDNSFSIDTDRIVELHYNGEGTTEALKMIMYLDNVPMTLSITGTTEIISAPWDLNFCVGGCGPAGWVNPWHGYIGELLIFNTSAGIDNRALVYEYLKAKYGL